jgi:hypothetical protein
VKRAIEHTFQQEPKYNIVIGSNTGAGAVRIDEKARCEQQRINQSKDAKRSRF